MIIIQAASILLPRHYIIATLLLSMLDERVHSFHHSQAPTPERGNNDDQHQTFSMQHLYYYHSFTSSLFIVTVHCLSFYFQVHLTCYSSSGVGKSQRCSV